MGAMAHDKGSETRRVKIWARWLLAAYLLVLLWLVLFKLSLDWGAVVRDYGIRDLSLVPFAHASWATRSELIDNVLAFVPFGLLAEVTVKRLSLWWKLGAMFLVSVVLETTQYVLSIGFTDITDVMTNTLGGLLGLLLYGGARRLVAERKLDIAVTVAGTVLLVAVVLYRLLFLRFR